MLQERIVYSDDFPIKIRIATVKNVPHHYHSDIELVYVLDGEVELISGYCHYILKAGDIFVNNGHEIHSLKTVNKKNVVAFFHISNGFFTKYFPTLGKSSYRTYSPKGDGGKQDVLRRMLLNVLQLYLKKSINYKNQCIYETIDLIRYLNQRFNLFMVDNKVVTTVNEENPVALERLSRIISYMYENYQNKVTLENIADEEHLSTFYLSHLIKEYTGMSFREFLCFVRVERSEIDLLGSNKKISQIAKNVGFSTTAYYNKFFAKWYGRTPEEHRALYQTNIKGPQNQELLEDSSLSDALGITKNLLYSLTPDATSKSVKHEELDIYVSHKDEALGHTPEKLLVHVSKEDRKLFGDAYKNILASLGAEESVEDYPLLTDKPIYGWDTIAGPLFAIQNDMNKHVLRVSLRDQGSNFPLFKGLPSLFYSVGVKKPLYFAYLFMSLAKGDIISRGPYHLVIRSIETQTGKTKKKARHTYYLFVFNYDEQIDKLCMLSSSPYETSDLIRDYKDRLDININMKIPAGHYVLLRYSLTETNNLFNYLANMGFPERYAPFKGRNDLNPGDAYLDYIQLLNNNPLSNISTLDSKGTTSVNFSIEGAGLEFAVLSSE